MVEEVKISTMGMSCPKPLIETRKALRKMEKGQVLVIEGDHQTSLTEIPRAIKESSDKIISVDEMGSKWIIKIEKGN